jgi:exopolyphosphatase/guanosine-5'-triphosphate,3'-diphosphate pyrophosphatase
MKTLSTKLAKTCVRNESSDCQIHVGLELLPDLNENCLLEVAELATALAAIDIGSNAIRLVVGEQDASGEITVIKKVREPVRLGQDVFTDGIITEKTRARAIESFLSFKDMMKALGVTKHRAVATSALREAKNRESFIQEVKRATGIAIDVIDGLEEGRLIFSAVAHRVDLHEKVSLLIDIGGGSVELTVADHGRPIATQTFKLGTVRLLQFLAERGLKERHLRGLIEEQFAPARQFIAQQSRKLHIDQAIGTGGNLECLGKLRVALLQKSSIFSMSRDDLGKITTHLQSMTCKERVQFLRLRPDRADVVVPAALVTLAVLHAADSEILMVPYVGLRDGLLADLAEKRTVPAK